MRRDAPLLACLVLLASYGVMAAMPGPPDCPDTTLQKIAWGVGSSAPQVEGAPSVGNRSLSVWDVFAAKGGSIQDGSNPSVATDFYHKYKEDIALMKAMGVKNFRMSISWSRLIPGGVAGSPASPEGVKFYKSVFEELKKNGIEPAVTLYHWDMPQVLQDKYEGLLSSQFQDDFAYYAETAFKLFGDHVRKWITFNEPWVVCNLQYGNGDFAPGIKYGEGGKWRCGHNLLMAHAKAVKVFRDGYKAKHDGRIGMALWSEWPEPWTSSEADKRASQNKLDTDFGWFADAIHFGDYPDHIKKTMVKWLPSFTAEEKALLKKSYDYMGLTIYTAKYAAAVPDNPNGWWIKTTDPDGKPVGVAGESYWLFNVPWSISRMMYYMRDRYDNPYIWVLENGISEKAEAKRTGVSAVQDDLRTDYFKGYITESCKAVADGVRLTHFFAWSFTDNWEWKEGFNTRFGLVRVDFDQPDLPRRVKQSGKWLSQHVLTKSKKK